MDENKLSTSTALPFNWVDYLLFVATSLVSSIIGVYHAWKGASKSTSNYLMGGNQMGIFPIALSMAATFNITIPGSNSFEYGGNQEEESIPELYILKIFYQWYTLMGLTLILVIGTLASLASGRKKSNIIK